MSGSVELIRCVVCDHVDSSHLSGAPINGLHYCSLHHPLILAWHGEFERELYDNTVHKVLNRN